MANGSPLWTRSDLALMPEDGNRYEVLDGELFVTPGAAPHHQGIAFNVAKALDAYCEANRIGAIATPGSVVFGDSELIPDVLVIPGVARLHGEHWEDLPLPILVVEVLSSAGHASQVRDLSVKRAAYLRVGIPTYWVVDPQRRCVHVWTQDSPDGHVVTDVLRWQPKPECAPLDLSVEDLIGRKD
ncbi:MAG: Uma2 family endonuclease [Gemmatimonadaceae bacterium]